MKFEKEFMNTRLELNILGCENNYAKSAAEDAFNLVEQIEEALSLYKETSEVFAINAAEVGEQFKVSEFTMDCLELSAKLYEESLGAFDVCMGLFFLKSKKQRQVDLPKRLSLRVDSENFEVEKLSEGALDFGAIGKGYAVDKIAALLKDRWSIENALINFGSSTIFAIGNDENNKPWQINLNGNDVNFELENGYALGASSLATQETHIIDPMSKSCPVDKNATYFALIKDSAAYADALSTAFLILNDEEIDEVCKNLSAKFYKY